MLQELVTSPPFNPALEAPIFRIDLRNLFLLHPSLSLCISFHFAKQVLHWRVPINEPIDERVRVRCVVKDRGFSLTLEMTFSQVCLDTGEPLHLTALRQEKVFEDVFRYFRTVLQQFALPCNGHTVDGH